MNPRVATPELIDRSIAPDLVAMDTVEQFIARVLRRAHQAALAVAAPDEARAILDLAQSFADELATALAGFDRVAFVAAITEDVA